MNTRNKLSPQVKDILALKDLDAMLTELRLLPMPLFPKFTRSDVKQLRSALLLDNDDEDLSNADARKDLFTHVFPDAVLDQTGKSVNKKAAKTTKRGKELTPPEPNLADGSASLADIVAAVTSSIARSSIGSRKGKKSKSRKQRTH